MRWRACSSRAASTPRWAMSIKLDSKDCPNTKGEIQFSHKKHSEDYAKQYADLYANGCGECHHDAKGQPHQGPEGRQQGPDNCIDCHKKCGEAPKGKDAPKLDKKAKLEFIAEAYHDNCIRPATRTTTRSSSPRRRPR
ncbi:MAG: cytochrome c family protein [Desulfobacterales bacterium]|nr:cytochrome c family protein [Desulfobacterales bacterium]